MNYIVEPIFANNFGGNCYHFNDWVQTYDCAVSLLEEEEGVVYVDISSSSGDYIRMYKKKGGGVGFKAPWEIPEDEV